MNADLAIVTGTSRGLGLATAAELLARDWDVLGVARSPAPDQLVDADHYGHVQLDLSQTEAVQADLGARLTEALFEGRRRVALINNAALLDIESLPSLDLSATARSLTVNVAVPAWLTGRVLAHSDGATAVRVVDVSSGAAVKAYPGWGSYCASKAALRMFGLVLEQELAEVEALAGRDVKLVSYAPGVIDTGMQAQIRAASVDEFPRRARFEAMHADGELVDARAPALEIVELIDRTDLPAWHECRFGE